MKNLQPDTKCDVSHTKILQDYKSWNHKENCHAVFEVPVDEHLACYNLEHNGRFLNFMTLLIKNSMDLVRILQSLRACSREAGAVNFRG